MPNILFYSANPEFQKDLQDQIAHNASDFVFINDENSAAPDIIMIDEDFNKLAELQNKYVNIPVFLLTSNTEQITEKERFNHLITKPFSLARFLDELHACLNFFENSEDGYLCFNDYVVRPMTKDILNQRNNEEIKLTEKEVAVIKYLYKNQERIIGKNELLQEVWGYAPDVTTHTIETHIYRLRQKVEHDNPDAQLILTLDGGYQLKV